MSYEDVIFEVEAGIGIITLDRPETLNAFTGAMGRSLGRAYRECDANDEIRAVVLTGRGKAFCAGADVSAGADTFVAPEGVEFSAAGVDPPAWEVRKPVIAAVNGHAVGIGLTLALQCDLRFMAREGKYGVLQVRRGVMPDAYSNWTLPRIIGLSRAADLLLTGRKFQGDEAYELGVASRVMPADEVLPRALEVARELAEQTAPLSVGVTKRLLWQSSQLSAAEVGRVETELHEHLMPMDDAREGPLAFLERRTPEWTGRISRDWPENWPQDKEKK
ncbi:MAG: crotonase [bacterium]|nr:crotonase [bacterium]